MSRTLSDLLVALHLVALRATLRAEELAKSPFASDDEREGAAREARIAWLAYRKTLDRIVAGDPTMKHLLIDISPDRSLFFTAATATGHIPLASIEGAAVNPSALDQLIAWLETIDPALPVTVTIALALGRTVTVHVDVPEYPYRLGEYELTTLRHGKAHSLRILSAVPGASRPRGGRDIRQASAFA